MGFLVGEDEGLCGFVLHVVAPVRLHEHGVDLLEIDGLDLVADGFYLLRTELSSYEFAKLTSSLYC